MDEMARMKRARTMLLLHHPFWGYLAAKLVLKESTRHPTMATDGKYLWFNPGFTKKLTANQTLTGVAHEVGHCACQHHERRGAREPSKWNKAGDFAVNLMLKDSGFPEIRIPNEFEWCCDEKYRGMVAERVYDQLPDQPGGCCGGLLDGVGSGAGDDDADGDGQPGDTAEPNESAPPVNWKRALVEAANFAKMRGKLPAGMEELVDRIVKPRIDWKRYVKGELIACRKDDWSYRRPNRRYAHTGLIKPVPFGYTVRAELWLDSSGSISADLWSYFLGGVLEIAEQLKVPLDVGVCDAAIQLFEKNVRSSEVLKRVKFKGRGGTDFRPPFEDAKKRKPGTLIYLTDLCGSFPEWKPPWRTLWVAPHGSLEHGIKAPFGRVLELPKDLKEAV